VHIRNLVFEGGGIKGIAYGGAFEALSEIIDVDGIMRVGGSSAGAIFSVMIALNYNISEIQEIFLNLNFKEFMDDDPGFIRDTKRLLTEFGLYKGDTYLKWVQDLVHQKTGNKDINFLQLKLASYNGRQKFKDLYVIGSNLNTGNSELFCHENKHATLPIALAVRISGLIPFFKPIFFNNAYYVDGSVMRNYPITMFDDWRYNPNIPQEGLIPFNQETLGFRLNSQENIKKFLDSNINNKRYSIKNFLGYTHALINMVGAVQDEAHLHSFDQFRTIYCDSLDIKSTEFKLSLKKRKKLIDSGYHAVKHYFSEEAYQKRIVQQKIYHADRSIFRHRVTPSQYTLVGSSL
jgi:NTE family protein